MPQRIIDVSDEIRLGHIPNMRQNYCRLSPLAGAPLASHKATVACTEQLSILECPDRYPRDSVTVFTASLLSCISVQGLQIISSQLKFIGIIYINSVRTSQETPYVSTTKNNRLMLFRDTISVFL
jgi:hypothetical protein